MSVADPLMNTKLVDAPAVPLPQARTARDPRLDFFRGICMFIILVAHVPSDWLALWIPARFGFSDATEIFVFCSGMASAIAFGKIFKDRGMIMGSARVAFRVWQVYWAHICLFIAIAVTTVAITDLVGSGKDYVGELNLHPFFNKTETNLLAFLTLTYVPNYFDVLPMYLVILAMLPAFVYLAHLNRAVAAIAVLAVWAAANFWNVNLPAEPWSNRPWFFNPFGWQLVFFTGFALMSGWLPAPPVNRRLIWVALAIVLVTIPFAYFRIINVVPEIQVLRSEWKILIDKTNFGIFRYLHFLSLAYLAWVLVGPRGTYLYPGENPGKLGQVWSVLLAIIMKVGQQSLAVFVSSMYLARLLGVLFDEVGRNVWSMFWVNLLGFAIITAIAYSAGWFKSQPWKRKV